MTKDEALTLALKQLEFFDRSSHQHGCVWQKHLITAIKEALAQPEERNFCPRCGKRTADLTTIHTCTPPASKITGSVTGPKLLTDDAIEEIARKILSQGYKHRDMERRFARAIEQAYGIGGTP